MGKNDGYISSWITTLHITITLLLSAIFVVAYYLGYAVFIYAVAAINAKIWIWNIIRVRNFIHRILADKREWQLAATYDSLTGVLNRGVFIQNVVKEIKRAHRYNLPMSFMIFDLDKFKDINDTYGHTIGDDILIKVNDRIKSIIRSVDSIGRLGGEEFGILLPETDSDNGQMMAERIRKVVEAINLNGIKATVSIGVTNLKPNDNIDTIYERADRALFKSKDAGRNKVSVL